MGWFPGRMLVRTDRGFGRRALPQCSVLYLGQSGEGLCTSPEIGVASISFATELNKHSAKAKKTFTREGVKGIG